MFNHATFSTGFMKARDSGGVVYLRLEGWGECSAGPLNFDCATSRLDPRRNERIAADWLAGNEIGKATKFETLLVRSPTKKNHAGWRQSGHGYRSE